MDFYGGVLCSLPTELLLKIANYFSVAELVVFSEVCRKTNYVAKLSDARAREIHQKISDGSIDLIFPGTTIPIIKDAEAGLAWPCMAFLIQRVTSRPGPNASRVPDSGIFNCPPNCNCDGCIVARRTNYVNFVWESIKPLPMAAAAYNCRNVHSWQSVPRLNTSIKAVRFKSIGGDSDCGAFGDLLKAGARQLARVTILDCYHLTKFPAGIADARRVEIDGCSLFEDFGALAPTPHCSDTTGAVTARVKRAVIVRGSVRFQDVSPLIHATHIELSNCSLLSDLDPLRNSCVLTILDITNCLSVSRVPEIPSLRELRAARSGISSTETLAGVVIVNVSRTPVRALGNLGGAVELSLAHTDIVTLAQLAGTTASYVDVSGTNVVELEPVKHADTIVACDCQMLQTIAGLAGGNVTELDVSGTQIRRFPPNSRLRRVVANRCVHLVHLFGLEAADDVSLVGSEVGFWESLVALTAVSRLDLSNTGVPTRAMVNIGHIGQLVLTSCRGITSYEWVRPGRLLVVNSNKWRVTDSQLVYMKHRAEISLTNCSRVTSLAGLIGGNFSTISIAGCHQITDLRPIAHCGTVYARRCSGVLNPEVLCRVNELYASQSIVQPATIPELHYIRAGIFGNTVGIRVENAGRGSGCPPLTVVLLSDDIGVVDITSWGQPAALPFSTAVYVWNIPPKITAAWPHLLLHPITIEIGHGRNRAVAHFTAVPIGQQHVDALHASHR
jgi:hypothetical protein